MTKRPGRTIQGLLRSALGGLAVVLVVTAARLPQARAASKRVRVRGRCNSCHKAVFKEWKGSPHQQAWTDPVFVRLSADRTRKECLGCHAPDTLYAAGFGKEPAVRDKVQASGVDCAACHRDTNDMIHGALGLNPEDHDVTKDAKLGTVDMCASCHAKHGTVAEFKTTKWASDPHACLGCHMPPEERPLAVDGRKRTAHSHAFRALDNPELMKKGLKLEAALAGDDLVVNLTSRHVGHMFPTGHDTKQAVLEVRLGDGPATTAVLAKDVGGKDTRLAPGATFTLKAPTGGKHGKATIRLLHKATPDASDAETKVLLTTQMDF